MKRVQSAPRVRATHDLHSYDHHRTSGASGSPGTVIGGVVGDVEVLARTPPDGSRDFPGTWVGEGEDAFGSLGQSLVSSLEGAGTRSSTTLS